MYINELKSTIQHGAFFCKKYYFYYYDKQGKRVSRSTGQAVKYKAEEYVQEFLKLSKSNVAKNTTFGEYAAPFFLWDSCPHIRRLLDERKSITHRHARNQRYWIAKYIFPDKLSENKLAEITRADLIDFRSRLLKNIPEKINSVNKVISVVKTIFKEALIREDIDKDPTMGLGNIKKTDEKPGIFTIDELDILFPIESFSPWKEAMDYTCFLLASTTGMRRGEILALKWENIDLEKGIVKVYDAWKDIDESGLPKWNNTRITPVLLFRQRTLSRLKELKIGSNKSDSNDLVFCYADGTRLGNTWWRKRFVCAMVKAGIDRVARNLKPHSFRHSLNTILRDAGKDSAKIRAALGWKQERTQDGYTHFDEEHFKDLVIGE
ncbi:MAG TPA: site-specific integrase [Spirochaetes bacterium]|nr:site-specific integrase [Spirochaetota bacterium]